MSNELYHWKYLKREKVGDKWKYYYDTSAMKNDAKKSLDIGIGSKARMQEAKAKLDQATVKRNAMIRRETKAAGESNIGQDVRNRTTQYQSKNYHESERDRYNQQIAKESSKFTPKTARDISEMADNLAKANKHHALAEAAKLGVEGYQRRIDEKTEKLSTYRENSAIAAREQIKAAEEYAKAQEEYFNTPLGKLERAKENIAKARDYVYELFDDSPATRAKRAAKRASKRKKKK